MAHKTVILLAAAMAGGGCLTTGDGGYGYGDDDDDVENPDGDADSDADSDSDDEWVCPAYPDGPYGFERGDVLQNFTLPGSDTVDEEWSMQDVWCMGQREENPATAMIINVHSMT